MKRLFLLLIFFAVNLNLFSQNDLEINKEFSLFTSQQVEGYFKPLFTTVGESFNTGLNTTAFYSNNWSIALDFSVMGMYIPSSQKNYNAELPDMYGVDEVTKTAELRNGKLSTSLSGFTKQPTIYGGISNPIFAAPQNHLAPDSFYKSVAYAEGNKIDFIPGLPVVQLVAGFPTRTQLRFRFFRYSLNNEPLTYFTLALNQNIDRFFELFPEEQNMALSAHLAYHSISRQPGIDLSSLAAGVHFSKTFNSGISLYSSFQYENLNGNFYAIKEDYNEDDVLNSPYAEVRNGDPLDADISSFTSFRLKGGVSYKIGIFDLYADAAYASQPVFKAGFSIWILDNKDKPKYVPPTYNPRIEEPVRDLYTGVIEPEQKIFPAKEIDKPVKIVIPPVLTAETQAYTFIDSTKVPLKTMKLEEYEINEMRALLPYIFFDENSSEIPERYKLLSANDSTTFHTDSLVGKSTLDNYYQILNVIGDRMNTYESANITLTGCNSNSGNERNNTELSAQRAYNIRDYLINVWEIDSSRISVVARNLPATPSNTKKEEGIEENRRVEIESDLWEITAPIIIQDTLRKIEPENIVFENKTESEAGLQNWNLTIKDNNSKIKSYAGTNQVNNSIQWDLDSDDNLKSILRNNFNYQLNVTDSAEQIYSTELKSVPVDFTSLDDKRLANKQDTIYQKYNLILFEFNSSELGSDNQRIVEVIKKKLKLNSEVTVNGYTDMIGDEDYNQRLSKRRAQSAADAVNHKKTNVIGWGESQLLYNNNTPEGRFYCRTVVIDVKTPTND